MHIDWWTLGLQTINAVALIWILAHFLFRPVARIVAQRQEAVSKLLDDAASAKAGALAQQQSLASETAALAQQREQIIQTAMTEATALKTALEAAAHQDADKLRDAGYAQIAQAREDAATADADRASLFALDIAAGLLTRLPQDTRVTGFIQGLADALGQLSGTTRMQLADSGESLRLTSARALSAEELSACRTAFSKVLGKDLPVEVNVDPAVIAGLELEMSHGIVRNSFRDDLAHLKTALLAHDSLPVPLP
jgi:F-type H+-transporting ATPase subunit b